MPEQTPEPTMRQRKFTIDDQTWGAMVALAAELDTNVSELVRRGCIQQLTFHGVDVDRPRWAHQATRRYARKPAEE